jgi:hypothetical protein
MSRRQGPRSHRIPAYLTGILLLVPGAIGGASPAWAWGDLGHKIVGPIGTHSRPKHGQASKVRPRTDPDASVLWVT